MKARNHPKVHLYLEWARDYLEQAVREPRADMSRYFRQCARRDVKLARFVFRRERRSQRAGRFVTC